MFVKALMLAPNSMCCQSRSVTKSHISFFFFFHDERKGNEDKKIDDANITFNVKKTITFDNKKNFKMFKKQKHSKFFFHDFDCVIVDVI